MVLLTVKENSFQTDLFINLVIQASENYGNRIDKKLFINTFKQHRKVNSYTFRQTSCLWTGRNRGVYKLFNLTRHKVKSLSEFGLLPGVTQFSW